jgi:general secretion pathway protein C
VKACEIPCGTRFAVHARMHRRSFAPLAPLAVATLALCAWLHARGVCAIVGGSLSVPLVHIITEAQAAPEPVPVRSAGPILARNPFDSVTGPLGVPRAESADPTETGDTRPCEGVRVVSIVASSDPDSSLVMLHVPGEADPILRRRGDDVLAIGSGRVLLQRDGKRCIARMFQPGTATSPPPTHTVAPGPVTPGIVRNGPDSYVLDRSARDALIEGGAELMRSIAVRPETQGADVVGLRISALKPGTPLDSLGVRAGDVLMSIDGISLGSPDRMLEAYARVRSEERVRVVVQRDGHPLQLDYEVR